MPLGTYKQTEKISTIVQRIRGNCQSGMFMDGDSGKKQIDSELKGIIVYHEELLGMIPPLKTYDQLVQQLKQGQKPVPKEEDIKEIVESLTTFCKDWVSIYFIPLISPTSMGSKAVKNRWIAPRCLTQMFIKSGSLWGKSESNVGFYDYSKALLRNQTAMSDVVTNMVFDTTHKAPGGTDCKGIQFSFESPSDEPVIGFNGEQERGLDLFAEVQEWLGTLNNKSISELQSIFTITPGFLEQLMRLEGKEGMALEFLSPDKRMQATSYLIANALSSITKVAFTPSQVLTFMPSSIVDEERMTIGDFQEQLSLPGVILPGDVTTVPSFADDDQHIPDMGEIQSQLGEVSSSKTKK